MDEGTQEVVTDNKTSVQKVRMEKKQKEALVSPQHTETQIPCLLLFCVKGETKG